MTRIKMVLAQSPDKPDGDIDDGLTLLLGLTVQGQIDLDAYLHAASPWLATRRHGEGHAHTLEVIRLDEGWALQSVDHHDDPISTFDGHLFRPGELVRVRQPNGQDLLYRIVAAEPDANERPDQALSV